jgi:predicted O-methyltransferase YrrM
MIEIQKKYEDYNLKSCSVPIDDGWIFEMCLNYVKPKNILEIGFYKGGSAFIMMSLKEDVRLTSVDPIQNETSEIEGRSDFSDEERAINLISEEFKDRFTFIRKGSQNVREDLKDQKFDFMYIDGDHWEKGIRNDFQLMIDLGIKYALVDDWVQPQRGPKSVPTVWAEEFKDKLKIKSAFYRKDAFQGSHIPMVLVENMVI